MNDQISLLLLWMYKLGRQQSNLRLLPIENLQNIFDATTKQFCTGNRIRGTQQAKYLGNTFVFYFCLYFMSPKWTRTNIAIEITLSLIPNCVYCLYRQSTDFSEHILKFSLQLDLFSSHMATRILSSMFLFVFLLLKVLKCEVANFSRSSLAHTNGRQIIILWHSIKS